MPFVQEGDYIYGLPAGMVSAWWAEAEDGSALVGCFQRPGGPLYQTEGWQECDVVVTPTPEPATLLLLATGLLTLGLLARRKRVTG
jgi:hypothetical protein